MKRLLIFILCLAAGITFSGCSDCITVEDLEQSGYCNGIICRKPFPAEQYIRDYDIVHCKITKFVKKPIPFTAGDKSFIIVDYEFATAEVKDVLKGDIKDKEIIIFEDKKPLYPRTDDVPVLQEGDEVVLFLKHTQYSIKGKNYDYYKEDFFPRFYVDQGTVVSTVAPIFDDLKNIQDLKSKIEMVVDRKENTLAA